MADLLLHLQVSVIRPVLNSKGAVNNKIIGYGKIFGPETRGVKKGGWILVHKA